MLSVISAIASAYAAWETAKQAKYAQLALTASDLNDGFVAFYDAWANLCETIDLTDGYIGFTVRSANNYEFVVVHATDLGYSFSSVEQPHYRMSVIRAMDETIAAHDKLALWLPSSTIETMRFNQVITNLIALSRVDVSESDARHFSAMFRQVGYCRIWKRWFMTWFKEGYLPAPDIAYKNVRLVFEGRNGNSLSNSYIDESRLLPWTEIHKYAPP